MASAPIFYTTVTGYVALVLLAVALVVEVWAFVHVLTLLFGVVRSPLGAIAVAIALVYLLDTRPALRDAVDGRGGW